MSNGTVHPVTAQTVVLQGRVVTMGPAGVLPRGAIYVDRGQIIAVAPVNQAPPAAFEAAPRIKTNATIYPGLIELHNHLCYNAMPLWNVPARYENNGQWRTADGDYARRITKPSQVLGGTEGVVEALVRFVECRCLLGGVTTSQGVTLSSEAGIKSIFNGLVRNVEKPEDPLPAAGTGIANPSKGKAAEYRAKLAGHTCYLQHLSEGVDPTARSWFLNLQDEDGAWAITDSLCGIHSTALKPEDFRVLAAHGGSMVWSPLSNYLLYGRTADIRSAKDADVLIGLGSDWAPSGSKSLLGELKVAWLASQEAGGVFTAAELVAMATSNAARILKWDNLLGTIEPGKRADFMVLDGRKGDDYLRVIEARDASVALVVIDGVPRFGKRPLMSQFGLQPGDVEEIRVGRAKRWLYLTQEDAHSLVRNLGLRAASARLRDALQRLPELAQALDDKAASGVFAGSADATGTPWRVALDFDQDPVDLALAARPLADFVTEPMSLDGITVADDPLFLPRLSAARNLPDFVKTGLPALYGQEVPVSDAVGFLKDNREEVPVAVLAAQELRFLAEARPALGLAERLTIVDQALVLLEQNYVHLPFKRAMHAVDPLQRLRLLRHRMEATEEADIVPEMAFHAEIASVFNSLRDLHTTYRLPYPYKGLVAWLPFTVEEFWEDGQCRYLVSRVIGKPGPASFQAGVEALYWNGVPFARVIALNAERQAGGNPAARLAQGLNSLTIRPLSHGLMPDEEWVTLRFRDHEGEVHDWTQPWLVFQPGRSPLSVDPEDLAGRATATALAVDPYADEIQEAKRLLYAGGVALKEHGAVTVEQDGTFRSMGRAIRNASDAAPTFLPTVFRASKVQTDRGTFGYIRIFTFNVSDADAFVAEFVRLARQLPGAGLIIDVRGNGGGLIPAAERLLQVLTPGKIEPQRTQFISTALNLQICRHHAPSDAFPDLDLGPWIGSIRESVETGATYSRGFPITDPQACNDRGQAYYGPVVLITDALCYSATDMFVAGFQDHGIGKILGTSARTGAGGANVWSQAVLSRLAMSLNPEGATLLPYVPLPRGADFRVAMRRTLRVGANADVLVEDLGVRPDQVHRMTRRDLLEGNVDLIEEAGALLAAMKPHALDVELVFRGDGLPLVRVTVSHVTRVDVRLDGRFKVSLDIEGERTEIDLQALRRGVTMVACQLELLGYEDDILVAAYRCDLRDALSAAASEPATAG